MPTGFLSYRLKRTLHCGNTLVTRLCEHMFDAQKVTDDFRLGSDASVH
jgi:hypothetical protein